VAQIDERVVAMSFETAKFDAGVQKTLSGLKTLSDALNNISKLHGLDQIEKSASKVTLNGPMSALDKLKGKFDRTNAGSTFSNMEKSADTVTLNTPMSALDKLKARFGQMSAGTTFTDMERAADQVSFSGLTRAIQGVSSQFSIMEGAAAVALGNVASRVAMAGANFAKSFSFDPVNQGFQEYQTNLGSIQTILANTADSGGNLQTVNAALTELNRYSDKTIYNFSEMAKNIGTFTAAGVQLKPATAAIKGIANLAALSGSNSQQASTAMYQLSQAIAAGRVGLQDWNSVVNAGMGGAVFQKALMRTAENMGTLTDGAVKIDKATGKATVNGESFRESIMAKPGEKSWLTSDVLTRTLSQFTGDMTDAQLAAQGFSDEQIKAIQNQAKMAQAAATEVKTLPQVFDVAKETIGSGWSATFQTIFGDFSESKKTFTDLSNTINGFINVNSNARNKVLAEWKKLGGRNVLIEGIKDAFQGLISVINPVKDAFREIFPPQTGRDLLALTERFRDFAQSLKISPETADLVKRSFQGVFALFDIGRTIVGEIISVLGHLFGIVGKGSGGFLTITASIGDFLVGVDDAISKGNALHGMFVALESILRIPIKLLGVLGGALANLFGIDLGTTQGLEDSFQGINDKLGPLSRVVDLVSRGLGALERLLGGVKTALDPWFAQMADKLSTIGDIFSNAFRDLDYDKIMSGLQTGLLAGIMLAIKKAIGIDSIVNLGLGDSLKGVNDMLKGFTGNLEAMQGKLHAEALLAIAGAVVVLAAGILVLSKINGDDLSRAMTAVAVGLGELMGAMKLMTSGMGKLGILQLPVIAGAMMGLALAVTILAGAMKIFATMSWEDIAKGMIGVAGALAGIAAGMKLMGGGVALGIQAAGLILLGAALNIIAVAVKQFSDMQWEDIARGLFGVVEALGGIALGMSFMPPNLPLTAAGLVLVGIALNGIAVAVKTFAGIDILSLLTGLGGMGAALVTIGLAIALIPPTVGLQAAGLVILATALTTMAGAIAVMGNLNIGVLVQGIASIGATLVVLAVGLNLMAGTLPGAAALLAASAALAVLAPTLGYLGTLDTGTIIKGLVAMGAAIVVIGLASEVAAPGLIALGIALIPLGIGLSAIAASVYLFAKGLALLGDTGQRGIAVMVAALTGFVALIPNIIIDLLKGLLDIVSQVAVLAPKVVVALGVIIDTIIAFVIANAPRLAIAIGVFVDSFLSVLVANTPKIIAAGFKLLNDFLSGLSQNIGAVTTKATTVIVNFLNALAANTPRLIAAGVNLISAFLNGIAQQAGRLVTSAYNIITSFLNQIGINAPRIITAGANILIRFVSGIASNLWRLVNAGVTILAKLLEGLGQDAGRVARVAVRVISNFLSACAQAMLDLTNRIARIIINFLNGLAAAIRTNAPQIRAAGWNVADAIVDGLVGGLDELKGRVFAKVEAIIRSIPSRALKILGIRSPSTVFADIGRQTMAGMAEGISAGGSAAVATMGSTADDLVSTAQGTLGQIPDILDGIVDVQPTITPVLDLSGVHREAKKMPDLSNVVPITAAASYGQAAVISQQQQAAQTDQAAQAAQAGPTFRFEQNNYSPESLSDIEIYRKTNNQLSLAQSAFGIAQR